MTSGRPVILVADDELIGDIIARLLSPDYEVLLAQDGEQALQLSRNHQGQIDLLLTDIQMPRLDGYSLYKEVVGERPTVKVVFISGKPAHVAELMRQNLPYLLKPIEPGVLRTRIAQALHS